METGDKYNQIDSWFMTQEPTMGEPAKEEPPMEEPAPKELPPIPSRGFRKYIDNIFVVICPSIIIYFLIRWVIWKINSLYRYDVIDNYGFLKPIYDLQAAIGDSLALTIIGVPAFIIAVIWLFMSISNFWVIAKNQAAARAEAEKAKAEAKEAKAEAEKAKAEARTEYDAARAEYDALPSVSQMEQWLEEDLENLKKSSLQKTGLDESEIVAEPVITTVPSSLPINIKKKTEHGHYLSSHWTLTILYISERSIVVYRCEYNWTKNKLLSDSTTEYFYSDIVAVERRSVELDEIIVINLSSGSSVNITLNGQGSTEISSRVDKAAQGIRRLLKDRK